jgi:hypothetical protein
MLFRKKVIKRRIFNYIRRFDTQNWIRTSGLPPAVLKTPSELGAHILEEIVSDSVIGRQTLKIHSACGPF